MSRFATIFLLFSLFACTKLVEVDANREFFFGLEPAGQSQTSSLVVASSSPVAGQPVWVSLPMPPIMNQGAKNSCVSSDCAYISSYFGFQKQNPGGTTSADWYRQSVTRLMSPDYLYNKLQRDPAACSPTSIPANLSLLMNDGIVSLAVWPYDPERCDRRPGTLPEATANRIKRFERVNKTDVATIKSLITKGLPLLAGIEADEQLTGLDAPYLLTAKSEKIGNHAVVLMGFDDRLQAFKAMNTWGEDWGERGFFWIHYRHLADRVVNSELYVAYPTEGASFCFEGEDGLSQMDLQAHPWASGGRFVGNFGESRLAVSFPVRVATAGTYRLLITYAGPTPNFSIQVNDGALQNVSFAASGWDEFKTQTVAIVLNQGYSSLNFKGLNDQYWRLDKFCIVSM